MISINAIFRCGAIALSLTLTALSGCGDESDGKSKNKPASAESGEGAEPGVGAKKPEKAQPAKESESGGFSLSGSSDKLTGWGRSVGKSVSNSVSDGVDSARDTATSAAHALQGGAEGVVERAKTEASAAKARLTSLMENVQISTYVNATVAQFGQQLDRMGDDPRRERTTLETATKFAIRQIPVLKQMDKYADARALYAAYANGDDAESVEMRKIAKRQVLLLSIQTGLDVTMLGLPSALDMPFEFADEIIDKAELASKASKMLGKVPWVSLEWSDFSAEDLDVLSPVLDRALQDPVVDSSATTLLTYQFSGQ